MSWYPEIEAALLAGNYEEVAEFYEQKKPESIAHYWYLGLAYLLQGQEEEAQTTWLLAMSEGNEEEVEEWTAELVNILDTEAIRQENDKLSWLIRAHIQEINPNLLSNILSLIQLEIRLNYLSLDSDLLEQFIEILKHQSINQSDVELLLKTCQTFLEHSVIIPLELLELSAPYLSKFDTFIQILSLAINHVNQPLSSLKRLENLGLSLPINSKFLLKQLFWKYINLEQFKEALDLAYKIYDQCEIIAEKSFASYQIVYTLMKSGAWLQLDEIAQRHLDLLQETIQQEQCPQFLGEPAINVTLPLFYLQDNPQQNRYLINQISNLFQTYYKTHNPGLNPLEINPKDRTHKKLKIGYLAYTLRNHPVGWLSRWLIHHHHKDAFEIGIYLVNQTVDHITEKWFQTRADYFYNLPLDALTIAQQIQRDEIDILVDLDSLTNYIGCQVLSLKPAPIQLTWLGFDASGLPAIDYVIADPYILPENAQDYYQEKIWRLPHCYLGVDGFEVAVPTLRREHLEIPDDAIIYLSVQLGWKRHPAIIYQQMKIIKEVPNSYFLIQGLADSEKLQELFIQIATQEGVNPEKLRFLPQYSPEVYRANLGIADVVLDTYPFNGGTTTLDILWHEIPIVTKVGQQWPSRNGYTLLVNAGITEGIAWNDEEYIDWGIRLGTDEKLRQEVIWKLRQGKKTAPLWNSQQFTIEMEKAYQQMWEIYCQNNS